MNQNNLVSLLLGAAIGGAAVYYTLKHQDEILDKINELEEGLHIDRDELIANAKNKLDQLTNTLQSTIGRYMESDENTTEKADEIASITEELDRLRAEVQALKA